VLDAGGKQWAEVRVYDTGEGIQKADMKNIFKPFFTTKRPGEGTGLGLTICQQLAHKHGGVLDIDSKEGSWTRVTLRLPYHSS
jgi:signal transduction histidine kinase